MKTFSKIALTALIAVAVPFTAFADSVTTTTTTTVLRTDGPIYAGIVENPALLEPLTLEEFQNFGTKPTAAFQQYQDYTLKLKNPTPNTGPLPFKMKIERVLTVADFRGVNVSPELAQQRYDSYYHSTPIKIDGRDYRYVFVYQTPV